MITGAVFAALAGAASLTTALWIERDPWYMLGLFAGPFYGAPIGAILAPVLAWAFLRRVPLGQMFVSLSAGTAIGGVVGWVTTFSTLDGPKVVAGLAGAVIGCLVAAIRLRYQVRRLEA
ncbi:MAG TPA: hypothetical protein VGJ80_08705 [Gemmatimonadales bacterium]|jgi:hypothetical protein